MIMQNMINQTKYVLIGLQYLNNLVWIAIQKYDKLIIVKILILVKCHTKMSCKNTHRSGNKRESWAKSSRRSTPLPMQIIRQIIVKNG